MKIRIDIYLKKFNASRCRIKILIIVHQRFEQCPALITTDPNNLSQSKRSQSLECLFMGPTNKTVYAVVACFSLIYCLSNPTLYIPNPCNPIASRYVNLIRSNTQDTTSAVQKWKTKPTAGIDKLPSFLVSDCASIFVKLL